MSIKDLEDIIKHYQHTHDRRPRRKEKGPKTILRNNGQNFPDLVKGHESTNPNSSMNSQVQ